MADGVIGLATFLLLVPLLAVAGLAAAISVGLGIAVMVIGFISILLVTRALDAVLNVALYRYATEGVVLGPFSVDDLRGSFVPK